MTSATASSRSRRSVRAARTLAQHALSHHNDDLSDAGSAGSADESCHIPLIEQLLPGHKIARGRGRRKQLERMSEAEKAAEKEARMEKMRISARDCRKRKKRGIQGLQAKLEKFVEKEQHSLATIQQLQDDLKILRKTLAAAQSSLSTTPTTADYTHNHTVPQHYSPPPPMPVLHDLSHPTRSRDSAAMLTEADHPPQQLQYDVIAEDGPYETLASIATGDRAPFVVSKRAPVSLHQKRAPVSLYQKRRCGMGGPPTLDFEMMAVDDASNTRQPSTPKTPLSARFKLELFDRYRLTSKDVLTPGIELNELVPTMALATPEPCRVEGGASFAFDCLDAEAALLL
jgi:predicted NBD/HSP70 family sugar kinase